MAAKTRAQMITRAMRRLGILGSGQSQSPEDTDLIGEVLDSVHDELRKKRLVNFASSSFPEWSQEGFTNCLIEEIAPYFGLNREGSRRKGERQLATQIASEPSGRSVEFSPH